MPPQRYPASLHPILLAPMDLVCDARLATAVSRAGRLGLVGDGYCDADWRNHDAIEGPG